MERYFIIDKFNTFYDWNLILTSKSVTPPEPKTNYVNIDGRDGTLDLSESLTGGITYKDRTITATFWTDVGNRNDRARLLRDITAKLHGKKVHIIEPDDPDHYFVGRVVIKAVNNLLAYTSFTIEAICEPWRYSINEIVRTIFVDDESLSLVINNNGVKTLCPDITVSENGYIYLECDGLEDYGELEGGYTYRDSNVKIKPGVNIFILRGYGEVSIRYREADL